MRIALIADLHGNLAALDVVLSDIARLEVERVVCLGDVAATGPQPREVTRRLRGLACPVVMGNADAWLLDPPARPAADETTRRVEEIDHWCRAQLDAADLAFIRSFRPIIEITLAGAGRLLCFHGSPRSYDDVIRATTPDDELAPLLGSHNATLLAGGHTHERLLRRHGAATLLNPGSVGMPLDPPWAEYAVVSGASHALEAAFHRVRFDMAAFIATIERSGMPHANWLAAEWRATGGHE